MQSHCATVISSVNGSLLACSLTSNQSLGIDGTWGWAQCVWQFDLDTCWDKQWHMDVSIILLVLANSITGPCIVPHQGPSHTRNNTGYKPKCRTATQSYHKLQNYKHLNNNKEQLENTSNGQEKSKAIFSQHAKMFPFVRSANLVPKLLFSTAVT